MNRNKIIENLNNLSDFEKMFLDHCLEGITTQIPDLYYTTAYVVSRLDTFYDHCISINKKGHPFKVVYEKLMEGVFIKRKSDELICPIGNGIVYEELAMRINKMWRSNKYHNTMLHIFMAFAARDYDSMDDTKEKMYHSATLEEVQTHIEDYANIVAESLDGEDLKAIIIFCGANL